MLTEKSLKYRRQNSRLKSDLRKLNRVVKVVAVAHKQPPIIGDFVDFSTVGIETALGSKIRLLILNIDRTIQLEQSEDCLSATGKPHRGTMNLTLWD
jgi:hypothetical protein